MAPSVLDLTGNTPVVELKHCSPKPGVRLFAKLEGQNATGSVKDRIVGYMLERAQADGRLQPGQEIVEATTGNTGIALAMAGRRLGHPVRLVVPTTAFNDVTQALKAWEPSIEWVTPGQGIKSAILAARQIAADDGAYLLDQFGSPDNPRCHYETTGLEVLHQVPDIDVFVCGLGTSGTAMGVGRCLKEHNPDIQVVVAEPHPGHTLQGIRSLDDGYVPPILDLGLLDGKILVRSADAFRAVREMLRRDGVLGGLSSGAVLHAALKWAQRVERANIVMLFADSGWKYLNSPAFQLESSLSDPDEELDEVLWW
jgi:[CysO sulfur-carrier protein]-thiocarboxylate-dependent cysteine synthase